MHEYGLITSFLGVIAAFLGVIFTILLFIPPDYSIAWYTFLILSWVSFILALGLFVFVNYVIA